MATLRTSQTSEFSPRRKLRHFQFALLRAARVLYNASDITAAEFLAVENIYKRPWRKSLATAGLLSSVYAGGASYVVGDVLTLVQVGGSGGKVVVASVNAQGSVRAVLPQAIGTGYTVGVATVTGGSGTGAKIELRPAVGGTLDVLDQIRDDVQYAGRLQSWYPTSTVVKDWGNADVMDWLQNTSGEITGTGAYAGGTAYTPGNLCTLTGVTYYCWKATTGNSPPNTSYWVPLGADHSDRAAPIDLAIAAITGRLLAITNGTV